MIIRLILVTLFFIGPWAQAQDAIGTTVDSLLDRMYTSMTRAEQDGLTHADILAALSSEERESFATEYWTFDVNVPVTVSILRDSRQAVVPFWIEEKGFRRTDLIASNMMDWTYEVWQKDFPAGHVGLGINGFDNNGLHYLVGVGAQREGDELVLSNLTPAAFGPVPLEPGAMCYHDWTELTLKDVPEEIVGHTLITTIRGRAREAHLVQAFRETPYPSRPKPDQIMLTWDEDPKTTQTVQWRTHPDVTDGVVRYRPYGSREDFTEVKADVAPMHDRLLRNDRYIQRFTATMRGLDPGTKYEYYVGSKSARVWSNYNEFNTAPDGDAPFSFVYFGDTHRSPYWGEIITRAYERHPDAAFYTIGGDIVSTGLHRDEWDHLFAYSEHVVSRRPLMPALGNHDSQNGLGCWMFRELFALPKNGPEALEPERAFSFEYGNALFIALDVTDSIEAQTPWLDETLARSDAKWKFVYFHFPPYCLDLDFDLNYTEIRKVWGDVFDRHHVDMVLSGHVHKYLRTKPMFDQKPVASPAEGTVYIVSIGIPNRPLELPKKDFAAFDLTGPALYQTFDIDGDRLVYRSFDVDGDVQDELTIQK